MQLDEGTLAMDATDRRIEEEVRAARVALLDVATRWHGWWTAHELKVQARNGRSSAVVDLALQDLIAALKFEQGPDLHVRLATSEGER